MNHFEEMAARYDTPGRIEVANRIADEIRTHLGDATGKDALDFGCGTGLVGLPLAEAFKSLLLVDAAEGMVDVVKHKIAAAGIANATALHTDLLGGDAPGISADVAFASQVLLHIPDTRGAFVRLRALLREGGQLIIVDFDKNEAVPSDRVHNGFVQEDLIALAQESGFSQVSAATFLHVKDYFMGRDASLFLLDCRV